MIGFWYSDVSRESDVSIQIYLRKSTQTGHHTNDMGNDVFLGGVKFVPSFNDPNVSEIGNYLVLYLNANFIITSFKKKTKK